MKYQYEHYYETYNHKVETFYESNILYEAFDVSLL